MAADGEIGTRISSAVKGPKPCRANGALLVTSIGHTTTGWSEYAQDRQPSKRKICQRMCANSVASFTLEVSIVMIRCVGSTYSAKILLRASSEISADQGQAFGPKIVRLEAFDERSEQFLALLEERWAAQHLKAKQLRDRALPLHGHGLAGDQLRQWSARLVLDESK